MIRRAVTIRLAEAVYKKMRIYSVESNESIQKIVEDAITQYIEQKKVK